MGGQLVDEKHGELVGIDKGVSLNHCLWHAGVCAELVHGTMWAAGGELGWLNLGTHHHATQDTDTSQTREPFEGREAGVGSREGAAGWRASGLGGEEGQHTEAPSQQQETIAATGGGTWKATLGALRLEAIRQGWMIIAEAKANEGR